MATHKYIHQASTKGSGTCDLCTQNHPVWTYRSRSEVTRSGTYVDQVVDSWVESEWHVCATCSALIDTKNRLDLMTRVDRYRQPRSAMKVTIRLVAAFFQELQPGKERRGLTV